MIDPLCVSGERSGEKEIDDSLLRDMGRRQGEEKRGRVIAGHGR